MTPRVEIRVRFLAIALLALTTIACPASRPSGNNEDGAASPRAAVDEFLGAVSAGDLDRISRVWGDQRGAARTIHDREQLEQRTFIMQQCLLHDRFRIVGETPGVAGRRVFDVELTKGDMLRRTTFTTIEGPQQRWYVQEVDLQRTMDLCPRDRRGR